MPSLYFAPNSRLFAVTNLNEMNGPQEVQIWDSSTHKKLKTLRGHTRNIIMASWSPDSTQLATSSFDKTIRVADLTALIGKIKESGKTDLLNS